MSQSRKWAVAIRRRQSAWGWTQVEMARFLDEAPQRINDWTRGRREPSDAVKPKLVDRLGISPAEVAPDWLAGLIVDPVPPAPNRDREAA